jgi:cytochrome P450
MRGVTLADGTYIPPNTYIEAPIEAIGHDPKLWTEPEKYDPWRFYNKRKAEEDAGRHQFVTLSKDVMSFGYGRHACPGRFFAANEIKLIMIEVLRKYDVELKGDEGRYKNLQYFGSVGYNTPAWVQMLTTTRPQNSADPSKELMMRRIRT